MEDGALEGMQSFDSELKNLIESGELDVETALSYSTNAANLKLKLAMESGGQRAEGSPKVSGARP